MFYFIKKVMKTFSIQLVLIYICLSNAKFDIENNVRVQRQWPFEPKNNKSWDGIMESWDNTVVESISNMYLYLFTALNFGLYFL